MLGNKAVLQLNNTIPPQMCHVVFFIVCAAAIFAGILFAGGWIPATWSLFAGVLAVLISLHAFGFLLCLRKWHELTFKKQILRLLWISTVFWYWTFAPLFFWLTVQVNQQQLAWVAFIFLVGVPLFGALFAWTGAFAAGPVSVLIQNKHIQNGENAKKTYLSTFRYPIFIVVLLFAVSIAGYVVGAVVVAAFAYLPLIEQIKFIFNGFALAPFFGVLLYIILDAKCGTARLKLRAGNAAAPQRRSFLFIVAALILATAAGSIILITVLSFEAMQQVAARNVFFQVRTRAERMVTELVQAQEAVPGAFGNTAVVQDIFSRAFRIGQHTTVTTFSSAMAFPASTLSPETQEEISRNEFGVVRDSVGMHKIIVHLTDPVSGVTHVALLFLDDFTVGLREIFTIMSAGVVAILVVTMVIGISVGFSITSSLRRLAADIPLLAEGGRHSVTTRDEVEEIADAFQSAAHEALLLRSKLEKLVEERTLAVAEKAREIEEKNRRLEEQYVMDEALLESIAAGVVAVDKDERILFTNSYAYDLLGHARSELIGTSWLKAVRRVTDERGHDIPYRGLAHVQALEKRHRIISNYYYTTHSQKRFPVMILASPIILNGDIIGSILVFRDVTKEKEIERAKTDFVSHASHQLRTPVSIIRWYTEVLLAGDAGALPAHVASLVRRIHDASCRMADLIQTLLAITRIELGTVASETPSHVSIAAVCREAIGQYRQAFDAKHITVKEDYDMAAPHVYVNPQLLHIVIDNLISNALHYTPAGGEVMVRIYPLEDGTGVRVIVADTGIGIPAGEEDSIFARMYRGSNTDMVDDTGSAGVGLYMVHTIVSQIGGTVHVRSQEGKGSVFSMDIPITPRKDDKWI